MLTTTLLACLFSFLAGFIDAVAGGGGLLLIPALFILLPAGTTPSLILGTNKLAAFAGTVAATVRYLRTVPLDRRTVTPAALAALPFSYLGARVVRLMDPALFKPIVVVLLVLVAIYTFIKKDFGSMNAPRLGPAARLGLAALTGALMGFYDGFLGPGTGSFLIFAFIGVFGFDFLTASASAKAVNCATNVAALIFFVVTDNVLYPVALPMAACNVAGGLLGARLAILKGSGFVRVLFLTVVTAILIKFAWESFRPAG